ncbi:MAG: hypothetical protein HKM28_00435 [Flavobacteriaceae bacterium]|nr:hypothetical protein [Flavobacteriaceae bacterium]
MKTYKLNIIMVALLASVAFVSCGDDDDNGNVIGIATCSDGIMNGDETGVDCGGSCEPCETGMELDFSGTYAQEDIMGRPGINTVFGGSAEIKNNYNVSLTHERASFQPGFQSQIEAYYDVYGATYEDNILGLDLPTLTTVLATTDALQVAPDGPTTYFQDTSLFLTGRKLQDDVIDVSLILLFGGADGARFDGNNGTPILVTDNVGFGDRSVGPFPYLETPNN